jgi:hypothetical protein
VLAVGREHFGGRRRVLVCRECHFEIAEFDALLAASSAVSDHYQSLDIGAREAHSK